MSKFRAEEISEPEQRAFEIVLELGNKAVGAGFDPYGMAQLIIAAGMHLGVSTVGLGPMLETLELNLTQCRELAEQVSEGSDGETKH